MTEDEVRQLVREALRETPGKASEVTLVLLRESTWVILLESGGEELAIKAEELPGMTAENLKQRLVEQIRKLF